MTRWVLAMIAGCAGVGAPPMLTGSGPPSDFGCPEGAAWTVDAPGAGTSRVVPDTEVHTCRDPAGNQVGPQVERWPGGGVALEGSWAAGARDGRWTTWYPDGAFRSETTWRAGVQHGARREIARDGRIVELEMIDGAAAGLRSLPAGAPMPEWEAGKRVDGSRYRGHVAPGAPSGLGP